MKILFALALLFTSTNLMANSYVCYYDDEFLADLITEISIENGSATLSSSDENGPVSEPTTCDLLDAAPLISILCQEDDNKDSITLNTVIDGADSYLEQTVITVDGTVYPGPRYGMDCVKSLN